MKYWWILYGLKISGYYVRMHQGVFFTSPQCETGYLIYCTRSDSQIILSRKSSRESRVNSRRLNLRVRSRFGNTSMVAKFLVVLFGRNVN